MKRVNLSTGQPVLNMNGVGTVKCYDCPRCKQNVLYDEYNYCPQCGEELEWPKPFDQDLSDPETYIFPEVMQTMEETTEFEFEVEIREEDTQGREEVTGDGTEQ